MVKVVGLDLSLSSTGVAWSSGLVEALQPKVKEGPGRLVWIREAIMRVFDQDRPDVVVIEGYSFASVGQAHAAGELGGLIRVALFEEEISFAVVAPATLKKYATGSGNSKKEAVLVQAVKRSGIDFTSSDEADAWWLRAMGLDSYGESAIEDLPKGHRIALKSVMWPVVEPAMTAPSPEGG